jgi:catechol 2,3-dioxygenase-like lactoylglutathione lyase family enzyme
MPTPAAAVDGLDHFTITTADLARCRSFYMEVLGLTEGDRPPLGFPGHWLYAGGRAILHLVGDAGAVSRSGRRADQQGFDHIALAARGMAEMARRLEARGVPFETRDVPGRARKQIFFVDPDGVKVELQFDARAEAGS